MKTKRNKKITILLLIAVMVVMYGFIPKPDRAGAIDAIQNASDTISDTDLGVTATHTFNFTTTNATPANGFWRIEFPALFTGVGGGSETCGYGSLTASTSGQLVDCTSVAGVAATTTEVVVTSVGNPSTSTSYTINITMYDSATTMIERVRVQVFIIDDVVVTATVDATLNFTVSGTTTVAVVNGITCAANQATATSVPFGTLTINATSTVCQQLTVETNADDGYTVTVFQDNELQSDSGSYINSFDNSPTGTGSTSVHVWQVPRNTLDVNYTYGHLGLTSNDQNLDTAYPNQDYYNSGGTAQYAGLNSSDPIAVMHHTGPSDGATQNIGLATVAYSVQVASLQEAGDYENTLTYICTPTY